MPPYYIGYSTISKVQNGYHGSVRSKEYRSIWESELQNHIELFTTKILTTHNTPKEANNQEIKFQRALDILNNKSMYINRAIGRHVNNKGHKHTDTTKLQWSITRKGRNHTQKWKQQQSERMRENHPFKGKHHTEESKLKMRIAHLGKKSNYQPWNKSKNLSSDHKQNISLSKIGKAHPHKGHVVSNTTREKIRTSRIGKPISPEHKHKISLTKTGKKFTKEHCQKISQSLKGRVPWNKH